MDLDISANTFYLQEIFTMYKQYIIPPYQRPYSWEEKQVAALLADILLVPNDSSYFMATIMTRRYDSFKDKQGNRCDKIELIDGQQRLVTLLVLFRVLERILSSKDKEISLVKPIQLNDNSLEQRIVLNGTFQSCLNAILMNTTCDPTEWRGETTAEARLIQMEKYYLNYLKNKNDEVLIRISQVIKAQLLFCVVTVKGSAESGALFEGQNARGYPLTTLDLTKNWLIYTASKAANSQQLISTINNAWEKIFKEFYKCQIGDSETERQYVRCIGHIVFGVDGGSYDKLKENVTVDNLQSLIDIFNGCIKYFAALYRPRLERNIFESEVTNDEFLTYAVKLNNMNILAECIPILCAAFYRYQENALPILKFCELFAFRVYGVAKKKKGTGVNDLIRLAQRIFKNEVDVDTCKQTIARDIIYFCSDEKFKIELSKKDYEWKLVKYFLMEYALSLQDEATTDVILTKSPSEFQIEHIASQQAMNVTEVLPEELVDSIGNLSITYGNRNQQYSNKPFTEKTELYKTSLLTIERQLASKQKWQSDEIKARIKEIVDWAMKRWTTK